MLCPIIWSSIILFYYRYSLILWFVSGDEWSREQVQHPPNQCTGTVCRNTGYCDYTGQGYEPEYDNHSTLEPHGHLPKSCGGSRHWRSVLSIGYVPLIYTLHGFLKSISVLCTSSEQLVIFPFHVEKTQILWKLFIYIYEYTFVQLDANYGKKIYEMQYIDLIMNGHRTNSLV